MKKNRFLLCIFLFLIILVSLIIFKKIQNNSKQNRVCFENHCFHVELALTQEERVRGLMFRENLDLNKGTLFVFEEEKEYSFWMKNTLLALDIIWINQDKEVVFIGKNILPCVNEHCKIIKPDKRAKYVLEVNAGMVDKANIQVGDQLIFNINQEI